ncbi:MAG: NAD-dependent epimerase/dehydratase family protein [Pseudomonadales bacterium]
MTGSSGFIGGHLVAALRTRGWQVSEVSRAAQGTGRADFSQVQTAMLADVDVVFHLAGLAHAGAVQRDQAELMQVNATATREIFAACMAAGVSRFIWLSSIKVLGECAAEPLVVEAPLAPKGAYAESKAAGERALLDAAAQLAPQADRLAIVRPPLVYGAGVKANFRALVKWGLSGWPLPLAQVRQRRAWVAVENLISLLLALANQDLHGQVVWHVADDEQTSVSDILYSIARLGNKHSRQWPLPIGVLRALARAAGQADMAQRILEPLRVDVSQSKTLLGWQPVMTQEQALEEVVRWYQTQS